MRNGEKLVLLSLASHANEKTGLCCPSVVRLMERTSLGKTAVVSAIAKLESLNLISVVRTLGTGSTYTLNMQTGSDSEPVQIPDRSGFRTTPVQIPNHTGSDSEPVTGNNRKEPLPPTPKGDCADGFEEFWEAYPKKVSKPSAKKAWARLNADRPMVAAILADITRRKSSKEWTPERMQYVPHPSTYLNNRRWEDEVSVADKVKQLKAEIGKHPANRDSHYYQPTGLPNETKREYQTLIAELKQLTS